MADVVREAISVSTHAPARGATMETAAIVLYNHVFQPTHPHGVRQEYEEEEE
mgnify:CR=1 FL=1